MAPPRDRPLPNKRRLRQRDEDERENASLGRALVRLQQMWGSARDPVSKAFEFPVGESEKERAAHNYNLGLYEWMMGQSPGLEAQLNAETDDTWKLVKRIAREIDAGRAEARNSDTAALKSGIASNFDIIGHENEFGEWNPQLTPLLTPIGMDWENEEDRNALSSPGGIVDPRRWYPFMYEGRTADIKNLKRGLFRGDLLVKAMNYVLHRRPEMQYGNRNVAAIIGVTDVNMELIAYITTLLRFALSSEPRIDGGFDSQAFYEHIVESLSGMDHDWLDDLLEWWNSQIFSEQPKRRANIFAGDTFAEIQSQMQRGQSPERSERRNTDVDGTDIGLGQQANKHQSAPSLGRDSQSAVASQKKRSAITAGFGSGSEQSEDEHESGDESGSAPRAPSSKLARAKLVVSEEEERESEGEDGRALARGDERELEEEEP
ncbi:hypothetical protein FRC01_003852, partial [Tulasnella sp. 417]